MRQIKPILLILFITIQACENRSIGQNLDLKITGDEKSGYKVDIYNGNKRLTANDGEFSLFMTNEDLSVTDRIDSWKAPVWNRDGNMITLEKDDYLKEFDTNLSVRVSYETINPYIIKKTVRLFQPSIPNLCYTITETNIPAETPKQYVTFEHENFPGGFVHELFPSAGFVTNENTVVGFLTDAGFKNHYTRTTRRRFSGRGGGMVGMRKLPDVELFAVATPDEQAHHVNYIRQTFGKMYKLDGGSYSRLKLPERYQKEGNVQISKNDSIIEMDFKSGTKAGINLMTTLTGQKIYTVSFLVKGDTPVALKLYRVRDGHLTEELEHGIKYIDNFPAQPGKWTGFKGSVLLPYIENDSVMMFLGTTSGKQGHLQIKDLTIAENHPSEEPYNKLPLGGSIEKVTYIFAEPWKNHHDFMISSQTRLAEGMGFRGTDTEKMLYANLQMLTWITSVNDFTPFNVPNMNYAPDMYNRDSFWSVISTYNKKLNLSIWEQWAKTQTPRGAIGTIITPYMGSVEAKDNEATIEWLIWAMLNKRRFGAELPNDKIALAVNYVLHEFDGDHDAVCRSHFSMSQIDIVDYNPKTDRMAVNQGMFAVALRTIKELGFAVDADYLAKAEQEYRNFYDRQKKHLLFDRDYPDIITLTDLIPEFLSLWLFDHPLLTDEMVINHLEQVPVLNKSEDSPHPELGTTAPICIRLTKNSKGYAYLSPGYQPFGEFGENNYQNHARDGFYYNGGSWLRAEYCAYVVGLKHGWAEAKNRMENRLWAEINLNPQMPYSKEFIPTQYSSTASWWNSTRGLCWNVFVLMANEFAGLRAPEMDPDYNN